MADPTITYGHKFLSDLTQATEVWEGTSSTWTECTLGVDLIQIGAGDITPTYLHGDILQIELVSDNAATLESGFYSYPNKDGANNLAFSTTLYPKFLVRYKTSSENAAAGAAAKVVLAFNGYVVASSVDVNIAAGHAQEILPNSFSTTWKTATGDITAGKTVDHILLFAECDDTAATGTDYVYYDFVLIHEGTFTFPNVSKGIRLRFPYKRAKLGVPGRDGGILQKLGMDTPRIHLEGTMEHGETWGSITTGTVKTYGEYLYKILRGMKGDYREPWNWLTTDGGNFKVSPAPEGLDIGLIPDEDAQRTWMMDFEVHSLSSLGVSQWDALEWTGQ